MPIELRCKLSIISSNWETVSRWRWWFLVKRWHDLFKGNRVIQIRHGGEIYTLRQTRLGKLILNK